MASEAAVATEPQSSSSSSSLRPITPSNQYGDQESTELSRVQEELSRMRMELARTNIVIDNQRRAYDIECEEKAEAEYQNRLLTHMSPAASLAHAPPQLSQAFRAPSGSSIMHSPAVRLSRPSFAPTLSAVPAPHSHQNPAEAEPIYENEERKEANQGTGNESTSITERVE